MMASAAVSVWRSARVMLQVNNLFNRKRVFPSGYSYQFLTPEGTIDGISYFYPQAARNAVLTLRFGFRSPFAVHRWPRDTANGQQPTANGNL